MKLPLASRQLKAVVIELYGQGGELARKFELPIDYSMSDDAEEVFFSNFNPLDSFLKTDDAGKLGRYRIFAMMNCNPWIRVPGWGCGPMGDDSHLNRQNLGANLIKTNFMNIGMAVFTGPNFGAAK